ncbi:MAG TPA: urate hydroxylase PuuD [Candidatus Dormibacteraeota bacterium]|nr:urate hydroxylase PuuD [Candidatus Dormibacteraeota bacterium]
MWLEPILRWIHLLAGVMWIGLLYYFNFVNVDAVKEATAAGEAAPIGKYVMPRALWWFRWSALVTWIAGCGLLSTVNAQGVNGFTGAFAFWQWGQHGAFTAIGIGAWLGTIMFLNVWAVIWPNQKKILGIVPATDAEKAKARRTAFLASRVNTVLSIPMLFFMATGPHALFQDPSATIYH